MLLRARENVETSTKELGKMQMNREEVGVVLEVFRNES